VVERFGLDVRDGCQLRVSHPFSTQTTFQIWTLKVTTHFKLYPIISHAMPPLPKRTSREGHILQLLDDENANSSPMPEHISSKAGAVRLGYRRIVDFYELKTSRISDEGNSRQGKTEVAAAGAFLSRPSPGYRSAVSPAPEAGAESSTCRRRIMGAGA
jgi:hypothetical protein